MSVRKYINVVTDPEVHKKLKMKALEQGVSMTSIVNTAIIKELTPDWGGRDKPLEKKPQKEAHLQTYPEPTPPKDIFEPNYNPQPKKGKK